MLIFVIPLLLVCTLATAVSSACGSEDDGLRRWLCSLSFQIPTIALTEGGIAITLNQTECTGLRLGSLSSRWGAGTLMVGLDDLSFGCEVRNVSARGALSLLDGEGHATLAVDSASLELGIRLSTSTDGLVNGASLTPRCWGSLDKEDCTKLALPHLDIELQGSGLVHLVGGLLPLVRSALQLLLPGVITSMVQDAIDQDVNPALRELDLALRPYLTRPAARPEPPLPSAAVDWRSSHTVELVDLALNQMVGPSGLNQLVRLFDRSGEIDLMVNRSSDLATSLTLGPLPLNVPPLGSLGTLNLSMTRIRLAGLDSFDTTSLLTPLPSDADAHSLESRVSLARAELDLGLRIGFTPADEALSDTPLAFGLTVRSSLAEASARARLLLALSSSALAQSPASPHLLLPCVLRSVLGSAVRDLGLGWRSLGLSVSFDQGEPGSSLDGSSLDGSSPGSNLGNDLAALINNAIALLIDTTGTQLTALADGLAGGPVLDVLDSAISSLVANLSRGLGPRCRPAATPPIPGNVDFRNNSLIAWLHRTLSLDDPTGFNSILSGLLPDGAANLPLPPISLKLPDYCGCRRIRAPSPMVDPNTQLVGSEHPARGIRTPSSRDPSAQPDNGSERPAR